MKIEDVNSLSHGVGGSYTVWQRKPPAHGTYKVETPHGYATVTAHAEVKIGEEKPSIVRIKNSGSHHYERELTEEELEEVKEYLIERVIPEEDFWSFNREVTQ